MGALPGSDVHVGVGFARLSALPWDRGCGTSVLVRVVRLCARREEYRTR